MTAGMDVHVRDVPAPIQQLVRARRRVQAAGLVDPDTSLETLAR
ncbi:hypothetical protein ACI79G_10950 [Geodermatophilus sp. SYSU D00779]